jgi:hypothetical protein
LASGTFPSCQATRKLSAFCPTKFSICDPNTFLLNDAILENASRDHVTTGRPVVARRIDT